MNPLSSKAHSLAQTRQTKHRTNRTENQHERATKRILAILAPKFRACADVIQLCRKNHGRLDPTLRMREVVHARSIEFLRVRNDRLLSGRILCDKEIFFPYDRFTGYKKSNQNQFGRALPFAFALTCYKIYFLYSSLSADACILVMACVDCARARAAKNPFEPPYYNSYSWRLKDVRANCFCASLLRTQIHMPRHATSCIERAR